MFQDDLVAGEKIEKIVLDDIRAGRTPLLGEAYPNAYKVDRIYVLGYVHQPGAHKIRTPITIQQAVALAGGATEKANRKEAIIRRLSNQIEQVTLGNDSDSKILIYPGDSVEIPKKFGVNWSLIFSFISVSSVAISILSRR